MRNDGLFDPPDDNGFSVTPRDGVAALFRRWPLILGCTLATTVLTGLGVALLRPTYESQAKVFIQTERQMTPSFFEGLASYSRRQEWDPASRRLENEMARIDVAPVAARVVRDLDLHWQDVSHPPLTQLIDAFRGRLGPVADALGFDLRQPTDADTVTAFKSSLSVSLAESRSAETTSNVIVLRLRAPTADGALAGLERLLDIYLDADAGTGEIATREALALVDEEFARAKKDVTAAERAMRDFLATTPFDPRAQRTSPQQSTQSVTSPRDDRTVTDLKATLVDLETQLIGARQQFVPTSETIRRLERSIDEIRRRLAAEIDVGAGHYDRYNRLDRTLRVAEARAQELERRRSEVALFTRIERPAEAARQVIEPPVLPDESDWKARAATLLLGSCLGLLLGVFGAGVREYTDTTVRSPADVRRLVGSPVLATIPQMSRRTRRTLEAGHINRDHADRAWSALQRAGDALASRILISAGGMGARAHGHVILVTSAHAGEGKTVVATLLARHLVALGAGHVLLLDLSKDASPLQTVESDGDTVADQASPDRHGNDVVVERTGEDVDIRRVPAMVGYQRQSVGKDLAVHRLRSVVDGERARFDWIVIDGRAIEERGMALLAHAVDTVAFVARAGRTRQCVVRHALEASSLDVRSQVQVVLNRKSQPIPAFLYDWI